MKWGCGFFISNELTFIPREDLNICYSNNNSEFEANWIEIQSQNNKKFLIAVIYHHPRKRKDTEFLEYLTNIICRGHSISNHLTPVTMMSWNLLLCCKYITPNEVEHNPKFECNSPYHIKVTPIQILC